MTDLSGDIIAVFENKLEDEKKGLLKLRDKAKNNPDYEPTDKEIEIIKDLIKNPEIYLDEGQLQKIYDYPQGTIWDFFINLSILSNFFLTLSQFSKISTQTTRKLFPTTSCCPDKRNNPLFKGLFLV